MFKISDNHIFLKSILSKEIRRSLQSRYDHRLHSVFLVAQGMSCRQTAMLMGDAPRTVAYWLKRFQNDGLEGLKEAGRPGRSKRLNEVQIQEIRTLLQKPLHASGLPFDAWSGKNLTEVIQEQYEVTLSVRQCQRLLKELHKRVETSDKREKPINEQ